MGERKKLLASSFGPTIEFGRSKHFPYGAVRFALEGMLMFLIAKLMDAKGPASRMGNPSGRTHIMTIEVYMMTDRWDVRFEGEAYAAGDSEE